MSIEITIPLFPLGTTLFPQGKLPLKVFEIRYLEMIKQCVRDKKPFGVVAIKEGSEIRVPGKEVEFFDIGTLAYVKNFNELQPGLLMLVSQGAQRFQIVQSEVKKNGLWTARVEILPEDPIMLIPPELSRAADLLDQSIKLFKQSGLPMERLPFFFPIRLDECGWVANRWAEILALSQHQKVHLLRQNQPRLRLDLVAEFLDDMEQISN